MEYYMSYMQAFVECGVNIAQERSTEALSIARSVIDGERTSAEARPLIEALSLSEGDDENPQLVADFNEGITGLAENV